VAREYKIKDHLNENYLTLLTFFVFVIICDIIPVAKNTTDCLCTYTLSDPENSVPFFKLYNNNDDDDNNNNYDNRTTAATTKTTTTAKIFVEPRTENAHKFFFTTNAQSYYIRGRIANEIVASNLDEYQQLSSF
jgi:hypothetical protein